MARPLSGKTNVTAPGGDYPYGRIKDNSGSNDGTPVNEAVYGDMHQFFEKLMAVAGVSANGLPENDANTFQYMTALNAVIQSFITTLKDGVPSAGDTLNKLYDLITAMGRFRGAHDASGNTVPGSASNEAGDFWRITVAGTLSSLASGAGAVKPGDVLVASIDGATNEADFFCVQSNVDQATALVLGLVKLYADIDDANTDGAPSQAAVKAQFDITQQASDGIKLLTKVVEIGDWNMDSDGTKAVAHGLGASYKKITRVSGWIRDDLDSAYYPLGYTTADGIAQVSEGASPRNSTNVNLTRLLSGSFDSSFFDATTYNRGTLVIEYED